MMRLGFLVPLLLAFPAAAQDTPPQVPAYDNSMLPYLSQEDSVTLPDGRELHMVCMGEGSPTVIFNEGGSGWSGGWSHIQPEIAQMTRTCSWDRPGHGLSDAVPGPMTIATTVADLTNALAIAQIPGPYVMVGISLGGLDSLLFADANPDDVAAMVLIDPSFPGQHALGTQLVADLGIEASDAPGMESLWFQCAEEVREGRLSASGPDPLGCLAILGPPIPPAVRDAVAAKLISDPGMFTNMGQFGRDGLRDGSEIAINPDRNYGDMPLIVLTATASPIPPGVEVDATTRALADATLVASSAAHDDLAALSTRGINARVPNGIHLMYFSHPQVVVDSIEAVLREARQDMPLPGNN